MGENGRCKYKGRTLTAKTIGCNGSGECGCALVSPFLAASGKASRDCSITHNNDLSPFAKNAIFQNSHTVSAALRLFEPEQHPPYMEVIRLSHRTIS